MTLNFPSGHNSTLRGECQVRSGRAVDAGRLSDPGVPLGEV
ncbi:hypothetical protein ABZW30_21475 [Kitasatospora sp. NPDC004669]